jgi:hypothetical protein
MSAPHIDEPASVLPAVDPVAALEARLVRLEDAVVMLQTKALEDRMAERTKERAAEKASAEPAGDAVHPAGPELAAAAAEQTVRSALPTLGAKLADAPWLVLDVWREMVTIFQMFFDIHYRVAWTTRLLTIFLLTAIFISRWLNPFSSVPIIGYLLEKVVDLALAIVMAKALSREARRYLETKESRK